MCVSQPRLWRFAMHHALRPYVTTGVALVGASVIAVAPIQPTSTDIQIPNPLRQSSQAVQLTQAFENFVNQVDFLLIATPVVRGTEIFVVPIADLLGLENADQLPLAAVGLAGPVISGIGGLGTGGQLVLDSSNLTEFIDNLFITGPATVVEAMTLGGFGPDLAPLVGELLQAQLEPVGVAPPGCTPGATGCVSVQPVVGTVLAGGLINELETNTVITPPSMANPLPIITVSFVLPGFFPTLQTLFEQVTDPPETTTTETNTNPITSTVNTLATNTEKLVTLDVTPNLGVEAPGKGAAANGLETLAKGSASATDALGKASERVQDAVGGATGAITTNTTLVRDSLKFVPETKASSKGGNSGNSGGDLTAVSDALSSTGKSFGDAVSSAVKSVTGGDEK
jgi:hypothetical protein